MKRKKSFLKNVPIADDTIFVEVRSGDVGRFVTGTVPKRIGIQFRDKDRTESPIYILDPWAARYAGWHLLKRGIIDSIWRRGHVS